jgi:hypothetical protein
MKIIRIIRIIKKFKTKIILIIFLKDFFFSSLFCSFFKYWGVIYFDYYGYCKFRFVCGNECKTSIKYYGQFCYLHTYSSSSSSSSPKNLSFISTSVINCSNDQTSYYTIYFGNGNHNIESSNISNNICSYYSGFFLSSINNGILKYSSFQNNYANQYRCFYFYFYSYDGSSSNPSYSIFNNSNIINNYK